MVSSCQSCIEVTPRIFISYRREDAAGHAGRLYDGLVEHFGDESVFRDLDTLAPGTDFVDHIEASIAQADVVLAVIGTEWLAATDPSTGVRRLEDPDDFVALELSAALASDALVVPILVRGAPMPAARDLPEALRPLARRNALELSDQHWKLGLVTLVETLEGASSEDPRDAKSHPGRPPSASAEIVERSERVWTLRVLLGEEVRLVSVQMHVWRETSLRIDGRAVEVTRTSDSGITTRRLSYDFIFPRGGNGMESRFAIVAQGPPYRLTGLHLAIADQVVFSEGV